MWKNPSKNSWIRIWKQTTSKIWSVLLCPQIHLGRKFHRDPFSIFFTYRIAKTDRQTDKQTDRQTDKCRALITCLQSAEVTIIIDLTALITQSTPRRCQVSQTDRQTDRRRALHNLLAEAIIMIDLNSTDHSINSISLSSVSDRQTDKQTPSIT